MMKIPFLSGKGARTRMLTLITAAAILLLFGLSLLLKLVGLEGQVFIDLTPEGFYTMSDNMKESCREIFDEDAEGGKKEIEILFCNDPDKLTASTTTRMTYFMALQMRNMFDNVTVNTVNVNINPAAVAAYRTTSRRNISDTDMIVSYEGRYKVVDVSTFWTENAFSYNGEYRMVSILASLTALSSPVAYFVTDHGETYYDPEDPECEMSLSMSAAAELIEERGLKIKTLKISAVDAIPEDCALLIINNPTSDFASHPSQYDRFDYASDTEKLDRYLASKSGAVIVNKAYNVELPIFESFIEEWGIEFGDDLVKDEENSLSGVGEPHTALIGAYDVDSIGGAYYMDYANLSSAPKMIFTSSGYVKCTYPDGAAVESGAYNTQKKYSTFINTSADAVAVDDDGRTSNKGVKNLAAITTRTYLDSETAETVYSYLFCSNTADFLSNGIIGNKSYANYGIMASVISSISRIDRYASMSLGGMSMNSPSYGGKQTVTTTLTENATQLYAPDGTKLEGQVNNAFTSVEKAIFTVFVCLPPLAAAVLGVVVFIKRKNR